MSASLSERSEQWTLSERRRPLRADDGGGSIARCASSSRVVRRSVAGIFVIT
jgi:hypothetical protein